MDGKIISHRQPQDWLDFFQARQEEIKSNHKFSKDEKLELLGLLDQAAEGKFSRRILLAGGLDAETTSITVNFPTAKPSDLTELERDILATFPTVVATQQRFQIFRQQIATKLDELRKNKRDIVIGSVPGGLLEDFVQQDFQQFRRVQIEGIDLDPMVANWVQNKFPRQDQLKILCRTQDAWQMEDQDRFDILVSNGLNIYEPDDEKILDLYRRFFLGLKKEGTLILSSLTVPPALGGNDWLIEKVDTQAATRQKKFFADLMQAQWSHFRSVSLTRQQLGQAGFKTIKTLPDQANIFPTFVTNRC